MSVWAAGEKGKRVIGYSQEWNHCFTAFKVYCDVQTERGFTSEAPKCLLFDLKKKNTVCNSFYSWEKIENQLVVSKTPEHIST